jgi:hypothetical protein
MWPMHIHSNLAIVPPIIFFSFSFRKRILLLCTKPVASSSASSYSASVLSACTFPLQMNLLMNNKQFPQIFSAKDGDNCSVHFICKSMLKAKDKNVANNSLQRLSALWTSTGSVKP